jgi:ribonuclease-3
MDVPELESRLGYKFGAAKLLTQALTHRSHSTTHNERLEFLGDSVLNCAVAHLLHERYTKLDEGDLSRLRSNLVKQQTLYEVAQRIELARYLRLGEGELKSGGFRRPSILADTMEALFGAIFLDGGFQAARAAIAKLYHPILETVDPQTLGKDAKTLLQEYLQGRKIALPTYNVVATHGAAHNQEFEVECVIPKLDIRVTGAGASRRSAEQQAAKKALEFAPKEAPKKTRRTRKDSAADKLVASVPVVAPPMTAEPESKEAKDAKETKDVSKRAKGEAREPEAATPSKPVEAKAAKVADAKTHPAGSALPVVEPSETT